MERLPEDGEASLRHVVIFARNHSDCQCLARVFGQMPSSHPSGVGLPIGEVPAPDPTFPNGRDSDVCPRVDGPASCYVSGQIQVQIVSAFNLFCLAKRSGNMIDRQSSRDKRQDEILRQYRNRL